MGPMLLLAPGGPLPCAILFWCGASGCRCQGQDGGGLQVPRNPSWLPLCSKACCEEEARLRPAQHAPRLPPPHTPRHLLVEGGLKRAELGEISSKIAQLHFLYYQRSAATRHLIQSYTFYEVGGGPALWLLPLQWQQKEGCGMLDVGCGGHRQQAGGGRPR